MEAAIRYPFQLKVVFQDTLLFYVRRFDTLKLLLILFESVLNNQQHNHPDVVHVGKEFRKICSEPANFMLIFWLEFLVKITRLE